MDIFLSEQLKKLRKEKGNTQQAPANYRVQKTRNSCEPWQLDNCGLCFVRWK